MNGQTPSDSTKHGYSKEARGLIRLTKLVGKFAGLLVALAAVGNGALDLYRVVAKVPVGAAAITNDELFRQHFHELPLATQAVNLKQGGVIVPMVLEVYENGDIYTSYAHAAHWFRAKSVRVAEDYFPVQSAYAAETSLGTADTSAKRSETIVLDPITIDLSEPKGSHDLSSAASKSDMLQKAYLIAELKEDHPYLFSSSRQKITRKIVAEAGYRFLDYRLQISGQHSAKVDTPKLSTDGRTIEVSIWLKSGSAVNRCTSWVKGILQTTQERNPG